MPIGNSAVLRTPNRAQDPEVVADVRFRLGNLVRRTRRERKLLEQQWLRYDNILKVRHDSDAYHGRTRAYLSVGKRVIENWVTKLKNDLYPDSGKWFSIDAESKDSEDGVAALESLFRRQLWEYMRVRRKSGPILRQLVSLGTAPVDIGWRYAARDIPTLQRIWKESGENVRKSREVIEKVVEYIGPTMRPVDLFRFYVYPTSCNDICDLTLLMEDILLTRNDIERLGKTWISDSDHSLGHQFENVEDALSLIALHGTKDALEKFNAERVRLMARGLRSPVDTPEDPNQLLVCTKAYWKCSLPDDADEDGVTVDQWYQVVMAGDEWTILQVRPVVFWDRDPSYLVPKFVEVLEEFYGYGLPSVFDSMAYLTNDILNQGADALTFSLNPIAAIDPGAVQDMTTLRMRPGAKWLIRQPKNNVNFIEPPKESAAAAFQAIQQMIAVINDAANVAPYGGSGMLGPRARGRALQTASGMAQVASENLVQVHDVLQGIEDLWKNPMLKKMYSRNVQCLDRPVLLNIEGARGAALIQRTITREDIIGEFSFRWQAAAANYNSQVRAQQMIGFFQQSSNPVVAQMLQQENARISLKYLLRMIWGTGLQLPDPERLIEDIQPVRALDAELENELFCDGRPDEVQVSPADDDRSHIQEHDKLLAKGKKGISPEIFQKVVKHIQDHLHAAMAKQQMMQMQATGQLGGPGGGPPGPGGPGGGPQPPQNPGRTAQVSSQADVNRTMPRIPMPGGGAM